MICETKQEATRVATATAARMKEEGYKMIYLQKMLPLDLRSDVRVENWGKGVSYRQNLNNRYCTCPFYKANEKFKICKHLIFADAEKAEDVAEAAYQAEEAAKIAVWEAEDAERLEARAVLHEEYQDACERYAMHSA